MMKIEVNGQVTRLSAGASLQQLLESMELSDKRLAIEHNMEVIPRSAYSRLQLQDGDRIEIVHAIGGG